MSINSFFFNSIFGNQVAQLGDTKSTSASDVKNDKTETMKMAKELIGEIKNLIKEFRAAKENNGPEAADKKTSEQAQSKIEQKMEQLLEKLDKLLEKLLKSDEESSSNKTGNNLIARAQKTVERTEQMLDFYQLPAPNKGI